MENFFLFTYRALDAAAYGKISSSLPIGPLMRLLMENIFLFTCRALGAAAKGNFLPLYL
jgi:hypothetical protein